MTWPQARPLYDVAAAFESAADPQVRVRRALTLLGELVPYDRCALLHAEPGREPHVVSNPELPPEEAAALGARLEQIRALLADPRGASAPPSQPPGGAHLAVPLLALDQLIGVLFVTREAGAYGEQDLCLLSVVAAQIAQYLSMARHAREKDEFLALLSHELRNPLAAVLGWARLLQGDRLDAESRARAAHVIAHNANALGRIIEDIVDLSRVATGKLGLHLAPTDVVPLVEAAVDAARPLAEARSLQLALAPARPEGQVLADAERLEQVVANVLANALKFTPEGGRVDVLLDEAEGHLRIRVRDSGQGIAADVLPRIFDRFRQADAHSRRGHDGLGLGLALVRDLVELHGGQVHAESLGEGQGTTITIALPRI
jgi:signal transduction histidine kinase